MKQGVNFEWSIGGRAGLTMMDQSWTDSRLKYGWNQAFIPERSETIT